jgi:hypothetical protein
VYARLHICLRHTSPDLAARHMADKREIVRSSTSHTLYILHNTYSFMFEAFISHKAAETYIFCKKSIAKGCRLIISYVADPEMSAQATT